MILKLKSINILNIHFNLKVDFEQKILRFVVLYVLERIVKLIQCSYEQIATQHILNPTLWMYVHVKQNLSTV